MKFKRLPPYPSLSRSLRQLPKRLLRKQLFVLLLFLFLSAAAYLSSQLKSDLLPGNQLRRNGYGGHKRLISLSVSGLDESNASGQPITVSITPRRYTREEASQLFTQLAESMEDRICPGEQSLAAIRSDLRLPKQLPEYGVTLSWSFYPELSTNSASPSTLQGTRQNEPQSRNQDTMPKELPHGLQEKGQAAPFTEQALYRRYHSLILPDGTVQNQSLPENTVISGFLSVVFSTTLVSDSASSDEIPTRFSSSPYHFPVNVLPRQRSEGERLMQKLHEAIEAADRSGQSSATLTLPAAIEGKSLHYQSAKDNTWSLLPFLGIFSAIALYFQEKKNKKDEKKRRERLLLLDYPELVSKLIVYIGAGLTVRTAFLKIAAYRPKNSDRSHPEAIERPLQQELTILSHQLSRNMPEGEAYQDFARRIDLKPYARLISILEQNRKNGSRQLRSLLEMEMKDAFQQRKTTARRLGEEAGTKLLLPLFLMLLVVMIIVVIPALLSFTVS